MLASENVSSTVFAATDLPIATESLPLKTQLRLSTIFFEHAPIIHHYVSVGIDGKLNCSRDSDWMRHVQWAKDCQSQNLQLLVKDENLIFCTTRNIRRNEEILSWFSPKLVEELNIPFLIPANIQGHQRYVCHICNRVFTNPNPLKIHLAFQCSRQSSETMHNILLKNFLVTPSSIPCSPYPIRPIVGCQSYIDWRRMTTCSSIGQSTTPTYPSLINLPKVSTSRRGHQCIYCGKTYSRKYGLKIHIRTHTGYKPLKCKVCLRPFGDPSNLNKHVRLHAQGNTPYGCDLCGKVLVRRRDLERHIKSRHPNGDSSITTTNVNKNQIKQEKL